MAVSGYTTITQVEENRPKNLGFLDGNWHPVAGIAMPGILRPQSRCNNHCPRIRRFVGFSDAPVSCSYFWFAPMECRSARINAGSFAANVGLPVPSVAIIVGRKASQMLVGPISNAGRYSYLKRRGAKPKAIRWNTVKRWQLARSAGDDQVLVLKFDLTWGRKETIFFHPSFGKERIEQLVHQFLQLPEAK